MNRVHVNAPQPVSANPQTGPIPIGWLEGLGAESATVLATFAYATCVRELACATLKCVRNAAGTAGSLRKHHYSLLLLRYANVLGPLATTDCLHAAGQNLTCPVICAVQPGHDFPL